MRICDTGVGKFEVLQDHFGPVLRIVVLDALLEMLFLAFVQRQAVFFIGVAVGSHLLGLDSLS